MDFRTFHYSPSCVKEGPGTWPPRTVWPSTASGTPGPGLALELRRRPALACPPVLRGLWLVPTSGTRSLRLWGGSTVIHLSGSFTALEIQQQRSQESGLQGRAAASRAVQTRGEAALRGSAGVTC